jgi:WD40 repeat protein
MTLKKEKTQCRCRTERVPSVVRAVFARPPRTRGEYERTDSRLGVGLSAYNRQAIPRSALKLRLCISPQIWDVREGHLLYTLHGHEGAVSAPKHTRPHCACTHSLSLHSPNRHALRCTTLRRLRMHGAHSAYREPAQALGTAFSPLGDYFASCGADQQVRSSLSRPREGSSRRLG